ncbi:MAG: cupin domain-containing protein [Oscillospiraceae bacterium]|nr:cupin domain-containing protein [Oscillospiraceae bacterium]
MPEDLKLIALRIRELRDVYGYTAEEVAADLGLSVAQYTVYETEGADIPISVLYHLANKYGVDLTEILTGLTPRLDSLCVVPSGNGIKIDRYAQYHIQSLAHKFKDKVMQPMLVTLEPQSKEPALVTHGGQEFNYVLRGSVYFLFDEKKLLLNTGDCVYFDPLHPHGQMAASGERAIFLTVITE